jgi:hypothetical protein
MLLRMVSGRLREVVQGGCLLLKTPSHDIFGSVYLSVAACYTCLLHLHLDADNNTS